MTHRVFVYGSLKTGFGNHRVLGDNEPLREDQTLNAGWNMFSMGGFPGIVPGSQYISGELYEVDDSILERLDWLEGNGHFYTREVVPLASGVDAWMYVLPPQEGRNNSQDRVHTNDNGLQSWEI